MSAAAKHPGLPALRDPQGPGPEADVRADALESGDQLRADEFMRAYERSPHIKKAELIQGVVYVASPVRADIHGKPDSLLQGWLIRYLESRPGLEHYPNSTLRLDEDCVVQPDNMLCRAPAAGQALALDEEGYLRGVPELVVEIAASSRNIDLHRKKAAYLQARIPEYLVWRTLDQRIDWFSLQDGEYQPLPPDAQGVLHSRVFPGLALDVPAALRGDRLALAATLAKAMK